MLRLGSCSASQHSAANSEDGDEAELLVKWFTCDCVAALRDAELAASAE